MRENFNLQIKGTKVTLVPYRHKFVEKYHEWMKDPNTLEMTASEPLSIEEEYKMQKSWREDSNKCTFIVLSTEELLLSSVASDPELIAMAGDVNMFFNDYEDKHVAEMEVMIAEPRFRLQGFARESVQLMMDYAVKHHQIHRFYVKINQTNEASIHLFKTLGYVEVNYVPAFEEYEFEFRVEPEQGEQEGAVGVNRKRVQEGGAHAVYCEYLEPDVE